MPTSKFEYPSNEVLREHAFKEMQEAVLQRLNEAAQRSRDDRSQMMGTFQPVRVGVNDDPNEHLTLADFKRSRFEHPWQPAVEMTVEEQRHRLLLEFEWRWEETVRGRYEVYEMMKEGFERMTMRSISELPEFSLPEVARLLERFGDLRMQAQMLCEMSTRMPYRHFFAFR